jgi:hypothetical protein
MKESICTDPVLFDIELFGILVVLLLHGVHASDAVRLLGKAPTMSRNRSY